jgi:hypothetical protein
MQLDLITPDVSAARIARDVGMQQAQDHADRVIDDWSERGPSSHCAPQSIWMTR